MEILLKDGTTFELSAEDYIYFQRLYPDLDIDQELRSIAGWNYTHPSKRKTLRGIKSHINGWLCRQTKRKPLERTTGRTRDRSIADDLRDTSWAT